MRTHVSNIWDNISAYFERCTAELAVNAQEARSPSFLHSVGEATVPLIAGIKNGGRVFSIGCGGSAAQASHFAAELVGRFESNERPPVAATALTADGATLTALANDFGVHRLFERQIQAHCRAGDVLVAFSTSGKSLMVAAACQSARERRATVIFIGPDSARDTACGRVAHHVVAVPATVTARVQELHLLACHLICGALDRALAA